MLQSPDLWRRTRPFPLDNRRGFKYLKPAFHLPVVSAGGVSAGMNAKSVSGHWDQGGAEEDTFFSAGKGDER